MRLHGGEGISLFSSLHFKRIVCAHDSWGECLSIRMTWLGFIIPHSRHIKSQMYGPVTAWDPCSGRADIWIILDRTRVNSVQTTWLLRTCGNIFISLSPYFYFKFFKWKWKVQSLSLPFDLSHYWDVTKFSFLMMCIQLFYACFNLHSILTVETGLQNYQCAQGQKSL